MMMMIGVLLIQACLKLEHIVLVRYRGLKRKLPDMLGSQWSKEELERFYEAYRKYGKDWKKMAGVVRNRSCTEMVEALYNLNRSLMPK